MVNEEWKYEPDYDEFVHAGYRCVMKRNPLKAWCGYIHLDKTHPFYGISEFDLNAEFEDLPSHEGLTYSMEEDNHWVIGFDCAHSWDLLPIYANEGHIFNSEREYRNQEYVCKILMQLADYCRTIKLNYDEFKNESESDNNGRGN